jgi:Holliday junction resolvase RusA-like endonuclease
MRHLSSKVRQQELDWRRSQVLQYSSQGYTQRDIAQKLQIDKSAVNRDLQFLKQQARNNLQNHIHEVVPMEFERCMLGMKLSLKQILEIAETAADPKTKLQAHAIAIDIYKNIMELTTNGVIVNDELRVVQSKMEHLNGEEKRLLRDIKDVEDIEGNGPVTNLSQKPETEEEPKTTNGVF